MSHGNKPTSNLRRDSPQKSRCTQMKESCLLDKEMESIPGCDTVGGSKDSILAKYVERFRRAKPSSRESRQLKDGHSFWWKDTDTEPQIPPQPLCVQSPDLHLPPSTSESYQTPSSAFSSRISEGDFDKDKQTDNRSGNMLSLCIL